MKKPVISILSILGGMVTGVSATKKVIGNAVQKQKEMSDKHLALFLLMDRWVGVKQQGKNLADYFEKKQYKTIAIYGMSYAGKRLFEELKDSSIEVKYGIDVKAYTIYSDIDVVTLDEPLERVDAVIVTPVFFFKEIEEKLSKKINCPIISLEDVLAEV